MARKPLFDKSVNGEVTITGDAWIDLGVIPSGAQILFGFATYSPEGKVIIFSLRTNKAGFSDGSFANTDLIDKVRVKDGDAKDRDYYKNAKTARYSAVSTGVEHMWLFCDMKGNATVDIFYWIDYAEV